MLQPGATPTVTDISVPTFTGDDSGTVSVYERDAAHDVSGTSFAWLKHGTSTDYYTAVEAPIAGMPFYADSSLTTEQGAVLEYKSAALHPQYILGIPEPQSSSGGGGNSYAEVQLTTVDSANKASISGRIIPFCILRPSAAMQVIRSGDVTWSSAGSAVTTLIDMTYYLAEANIASFSSSQNWTCGYFTPAAD